MEGRLVDWESVVNVACDALAFQIIPHMSSLTAYLITFSEYNDWYLERVKRPFWDVFGRHINLGFSLVHTAVGAASYIVYQKEAHWLSRSAPLMLCAVQLFLDFSWRPIYFNQKHWPRTLRQSVACTLLSSSLALLYHRTDELAGRLVMPYAAWWLYLTSVVGYVWLFNDPVESWKRLSFGGSLLIRHPTVPGGSISN